MPVTINPTNITFNDGSVQSSAASTGFNTVGSYCMLWLWMNGAANPVAGGTYASGSSGATNQVWAGVMFYTPGNPCVGTLERWAATTQTLVSGTWRWMAGANNNAQNCLGIGVRIS
jgi:hypothetical protein